MAALAGLATMTAEGLATAAPAGAVPVHSLPSGGHAVKNSTTIVYNPIGAEQTFTVPTGVTSINVIAIGAALVWSAPASGGTGGGGGEGEQVSGTLAVTPGNTLFVEVGGVGGAGTISAGGAAGLTAARPDSGSRTPAAAGRRRLDIRPSARRHRHADFPADRGRGRRWRRRRRLPCGAGGSGGSSTTTFGTGGTCTGRKRAAPVAGPPRRAPGVPGAPAAPTAPSPARPGSTVAPAAWARAADLRPSAAAVAAAACGAAAVAAAASSPAAPLGRGRRRGRRPSFATTTSGATTAAEVSITSTPRAAPAVGSSDLKVFLKHQGVFQHHRLGTYGIWVTNTGTAATTRAHPMVVTLGTGFGIRMVQGGKGTAGSAKSRSSPRRARGRLRWTPVGAP